MSSMGCDVNRIVIDGVAYVREDGIAPKPNGKRAVVVVDRGWIFAGDVEEMDGRIRLSRAVWLFRWERVGFASVVANPKQTGVDIRKLTTTVDLPDGAEIFRLPVCDDWGL
jgi:hypothetical protein